MEAPLELEGTDPDISNTGEKRGIRQLVENSAENTSGMVADSEKRVVLYAAGTIRQVALGW